MQTENSDTKSEDRGRTMLLKLTAKWGIGLGLALCGYTIFMWLTRLDTVYLSIGQYLDIAVLILPVTIILLAVRSATTSGHVSIIRRFSIVIGIGLISFLIYAPFLYAYHNYINPRWFDPVLALKEQKLIAEKIEAPQISEQLRKMKEENAAHSGIFDAFLPSAIILPVLVGLITWPFSRNKIRIDGDPVEDPRD